MPSSVAKLTSVAVLSFVAGIAAANLPSVLAEDRPVANLSEKEFMVSIDEIKASIVLADRFTGTYSQVVKMSDGSTRTIKLTPMIRNGMQVVELNDNGGVTYMGHNGTTINGKLMIQLRDIEELKRQLKEHGWMK